MDTVDDRLEILELIARYSHAADGDDPLAYAGVFTPEGLFIGRAGQPDELTLAGRERLTAFHARAISLRGEKKTRHHQTTTMFVELGETQALTRTYLLTTTGTTPGLTSVYEDRFVKTAQGWLISQRRVLPDVKGVLREMPALRK